MAKIGLLLSAFAVLLTLGTTGCGSSYQLENGAIASLPERYGYSPSVIESGKVLQIWWCGRAPNPTNTSQDTDAIVYETYDPVRNTASYPVVALAETSGAWDSVYTCNPKVVRGVFTNPLGDGKTYTYELFYVATNNVTAPNNIGIAFSNDGMKWKKYPDPVIHATSASGYGVGQPVPYNPGGRSAVVLFYENSEPSTRHLMATSSDGVHFTTVGTLTTNGMDPNNAQPTWGDIGYEPSTGYWYGAFEQNFRFAETTGGYQERGQYGTQIYRIPNSSLLTGSTPWEMVKTVDTNLTGYESNFLPGLAKDGAGNILMAENGNFRLYPSISDPAPAWNSSPEDAGESGDVKQWVIGSMQWDLSQQLMTLTRYRNASGYNVTTGFIDPAADFVVDSVQGHLYASPRDGADTPFFSCKNGATTFFVSADSQCEGQRILGLEGYGYASPAAGRNLVKLYRCTSKNSGLFVSHDDQCEGQGSGNLLGYALP